MKTLVVFSHLRWNFVYQRPQHLISRLAARWNVVFIEEPVTSAPMARMECIHPAPGVEVWRPHLCGSAAGFHDDHLAEMQTMVAGLLRDRQITDYWVWFYTPMAVPFAQLLSPVGIVYDCMDELTAFLHAPRQLVQQENHLFEVADIVFTGGRSLYNAKRGRHPNVHCFPSSVDARHFSRAASDHPQQAGIAHPRLGYCGVIDERVDLGLVAGLADARPLWQIVMVGPVAKIDPQHMPRRPNIHWLGQQGYADLPAFISGWDLCLLPFALNEATQFISPTKTLEYMACGRPSASTPIKDVVDTYGSLVGIAGNATDFLAVCDAILARTPAQQAAHAQTLAEVVGRTSWDATASAMGDLIADIDLMRGRPRTSAASGNALPRLRAGAALGRGRERAEAGNADLVSVPGGLGAAAGASPARHSITAGVGPDH